MEQDISTNTASRICTVVQNELLDKTRSVLVSDRLIDDLGIDSMRMVQLISTIEDVYKCEIDERHAAKFFTVQSIIDYIEENVLGCPQVNR